MSEPFDIFVIGAGVAGMAAAQEAVKRGLSVGLAEEMMFGGLVTNVNRLRPVPAGLPGSGSDLASELMTSVVDLGAVPLMVPVTAFEREPGGLYRLDTPQGPQVARSVIVATGATQRKLGLPGEERLEHRGVGHCADCDGPLYRGEVVTVVGGGDSALQGALALADYCSSVHLVHRGTGFTADPALAEAVRANSRIKLHFETIAVALEGSEAVTGVRIGHVTSGATTTLSCKGFFAFVGLKPNTACMPPGVQLQGDHLRVDEQLETSLPNVFAIGAVRAGAGGWISHAMADARLAVSTAAEHLRRA